MHAVFIVPILVVAALGRATLAWWRFCGSLHTYMYAKERLGEIFRRRPRAELDVKNPAAARRRNSPLQFSALRPRAQL